MVKEKLMSLLLVGGLVASVCGVYFLTALLSISTEERGILPRSPTHWFGVLSAPLAHVSSTHLFANAAGLLIFGSLTAIRSKKLFVFGSSAIVIVGGSLVWLFGRGAWHVGASGWVYGLWALNISYAWFDRRVVNILLAVFVAIAYWGFSYGLLPLKQTVSFEMHLAGALSGVICAYVASRFKQRSTARLVERKNEL